MTHLAVQDVIASAFKTSMKKTLFFSITAFFLAASAHASPTQTGVTGLLTVPTADTLDAGNLCVGLWGSYTRNNPSASNKNALIMPVTLTLGIGSFWEVYGTYPNLLFNGQEDKSDRGTADLGTKLRVWGKRSAAFKLAVDFAARRKVSEDPQLDGLIDLGTRLVASLKGDKLGLHLYGGYVFPKNLPGTDYDKEITYGGGIEFAPTMRMKTTVEVTGNTNRDRTLKDPLEASLGLQYYLSPHLTLNLSGTMGLSTASPDWKGLVGFSTCQGVGTYIKPVPKAAQEAGARKDKKQEAIKPVKIVPISPLLIKITSAPPSSKLEVPVDGGDEEIVIKPYGQVTIAPQPANLRPQPAQPYLKPQPAPSKVTLPPLQQEPSIARMQEEVPISPMKGTPDLEVAAEDYTLSRIKGVSPLFALEVKGERVVAAAAKAAQIPEAMTVYRKFRFPDVTFEFDQSSISAEGKKALSEVAEQIRNDKKWLYLRIDGHTDNLGSANYNIDLSLKRAIAVATDLVTREGVDPSRIFLKGMGMASPIADNATSEGRKTNRRCEILFLVPKEK